MGAKSGQDDNQWYRLGEGPEAHHLGNVSTAHVIHEDVGQIYHHSNEATLVHLFVLFDGPPPPGIERTFGTSCILTMKNAHPCVGDDLTLSFAVFRVLKPQEDMEK